MIPVISPNYFMQKASYMQAKLIADTIIIWPIWKIIMNKSSFILYIRYLCVILFISAVMLFVFGNYVITNSLEIIQKEYEGKDIEYPVEIINIQKKINDQLGLYRGARKLIGLLSILAIFFFMTIYADQRKVTNFWSNKR